MGADPVRILNFAYSPTPINVHVSDIVTWKNNDPTTHTVTSDPSSAVQFGSGDLGQGSTFSFTFRQAGDLPYPCSIHTSVHGKVHVEPKAMG